MRTKISKKGLSAVLIVSILGLGTGYNLPTVYAEDTGTEVSQISNTLAKLEIEGIKLDQDFSADINQYSATVENETDSIHILVEGTNTDSIISINGKTVTSGTADEYSLQTGQNIFLITVKDSATNLTNTYTLTVNRKQNSDNQLQNIQLSTGKLSPTFSPTVTQYNVQLPNTTQTITILPTAKEKTAVVEVNGAEVTEKGVTVNIPVGKSDILIVVAAEDGSKLRYTIHVERQDSTSGNGAGSGQTGNSGSGQTGQTGNSGSGQTGQTGNSGTGQTGQTDNSGSATYGSGVSAQTGMSNSAKTGTGLVSQTGNSFSEQGNTTNQTGSSQQGVSATVTKTTNANLSALIVSTGTWDSSFTSSEYTYHIAVSHDTKTVTINPTAASSSSDITIEGGTSKTIQLEDDNKTVISVRVTYDNTDRKTYVLVFDRAAN
ncbi:cadherin-like beta sandwich domain-containing protein [Neobacillus cucumis]|uniref:cadherin-like beta sandwich domain-containing protein n=1 Tax=Neobacillus cucumis TaxID=1740721 RepID=UPI0028532F25|nr:cadherin-like beta sandwich domain-containing protein [Neobacillus cucumis]MDR4946158.1 cadherin-like beta sandwich domain-containing protein [Neobacillus cucumis]